MVECSGCYQIDKRELIARKDCLVHNLQHKKDEEPISGFSCTSNTVKLFKHLDTLKNLQMGKVVPIMIHMIPTHRCQMDCVHCCFKNRGDRNFDMPFDVLIKGVLQFYDLGTRSIEITGGGEPTLYPKVNEMLIFLHGLGLNIGFITNTVDSQRVKYWDYCKWVRISLNTLDYRGDMNIGPIRDSGTYISGCYIWNEISTLESLDKIAEFSAREKIVCRIAPDCIKDGDEINHSVTVLRELLREYEDNKYLFLSDFNITTDRPNMDCRIHMIKPCFYLDGYVYSCPSTELAVENDHKINKEAMVCSYDNIYNFYTKGNAIKKVTRDCSYCKYVQQQIVLDEVLTETTFNEFA